MTTTRLIDEPRLNPRRRLIVILVFLRSRDALDDGGGAREGVVDAGGVGRDDAEVGHLRTNKKRRQSNCPYENKKNKRTVRDPGQSRGWCVTQLATTPDVLSSNSTRRKSASVPRGD